MSEYVARSNRQNRKVTGSKTLMNGGGDRGRTGDPQLAKLVLSQLSYAPTLENHIGILNG